MEQDFLDKLYLTLLGGVGGGDEISLKKNTFYIVYPGRLLNQLYCMFKKLYPLLIK